MSEEQYRCGKLVIMAILVIGLLIIGYLWSGNGRYVQFDLQKTYSPTGSRPRSLANPPNYVIDTRMGRRIPTE